MTSRAALRGQVQGRTQFGGGGAAVDATQVAALGDLPENQAGSEFAFLESLRRYREPLPASFARASRACGHSFTIDLV